MDFALSGPVPWADPRLAEAKTLHISQPTIVHPSRLGPDGSRPLWTYAQVPNNSTCDMTETVTALIERYAPGFRDLVIGSTATVA